MPPKLPRTADQKFTPKFTAEVRQQFLQCLREGMLKQAACEACNIGYRTFQRYMAADPEFRVEVEAALAYAREKVEHVLYEAALQGEPWAVKMWLSAHDKSTYGDRIQVEKTVTHEIGSSLEAVLALREQLEERRQVLAANNTPALPAPPDDDEIYEAEIL